MAAGTADELRALLESLLWALDESTAARRKALGVRPNSLAVEALTAIQDLADDAKLELPTLLRNVERSETAEGATARAAAVAGAMPPEALGQLRDLLGSLGVRSAVTATPKATSFLTDTYTAERRLREDAHRHVDGYVRTFVRAVGDRPLADYKRADVVRWIRTLEKLRTSYGKRKGDDTKSLAQIIKETQHEPTLNRTTIEKHITHLRAFFLSGNKHHRWCSRDEIDDLFNDVPLSDSVPGAKPRKSWTIAQLNELFASPTWSGTRSRRDDVTHRHEPGPQVHRDAYWWLPVAALWTGARLEELAQLHHGDLAQDRGGTYYLRITDVNQRRKVSSEQRPIVSS